MKFTLFILFTTILLKSSLLSQNLADPIEVVNEMNKVRRNPIAYSNWMLKFKNQNKKVKEFNEAINFLKKLKSLDTLTIKLGLQKSAEDHVNDIGLKGIISHIGSDNSSPLKRMQRYAFINSLASENILFGTETAEETVLGWIIDKGVKGRGHRKTIVNKDLAYVGVASGFHKIYKFVTVADFVELYQDYIK